MGAKKPDWTAPASKWATEPDAHAASIDRIIDAVATTPKGRKCVVHVDRYRLAGELMHAWVDWKATSTHDSEFNEPALKQRAQLFYELVASGEKFKAQLVDEDGPKYAATQIGSRFSAPSEFGAFLVGLDHVIEFAEDNARVYGDDKWFRANRPPTEWFLNEILPGIFKRSFDQRAGKSDKGPYSRFASAVLKEFGIKYSSVRRALSREPRRKKNR
jgi:hypothetical protein